MFRILPRQEAFFDLFDRAAANMMRSAELYRDFVHHYDRNEKTLEGIRDTEHEGDRVTHETMEKLDKTFLTPFDREDIHDLCQQLDDVVDAIDSVAKRFLIYGIKEPTGDIKKMTVTLVGTTAALAGAVKQIRDIKNRGAMMELIKEIHRLENEGNDQNHAAVARLFAEETNPIEIIKWKEIYERTERAIDRCEDAANTIETLVLKHT